MLDLRRGDVVLVSFPFVEAGEARRKLRPALVIQADRYNRRRNAVILAAITSARAHRHLPCKVAVARESAEGRAGGLRTDSVADCQTLVTIPREEILRRIGRFPASLMARVDAGIRDAVGL
jgi:mRNA-degrading endonuclease toxin of MazEF toxin-antitoxin module